MDAEQIHVNLTVASAFEEMRVRYFLGGSMASSAHGVYRATNDADFVAALLPSHASILVGILGDAFYADEPAIRAAIEQQASFNLIHLESMLKIDVFVLKSDAFSKSQILRCTKVPLAEPPAPEIFLASPEDTILAKLDWYRQGGKTSEQQWKDILGVLKVQAERLDQVYLREWAAELRITDLLEHAFDDAGIG
jgi:hypothetical protein